MSLLIWTLLLVLINSPNLETTTPGGHGSWMLMSYKNKKRDNVHNGQSKSQANSGSRFSVLVNEDEGTEKATGSSSMEPVIVSPPPPLLKEPKFFSLWKFVQLKTQTRNENKGMPSLAKDSTESKSTFAYKPCNESKHPMKDITNGNSTSTDYRVKTYGKPRKPGSGTRGLR